MHYTSVEGGGGRRQGGGEALAHTAWHCSLSAFASVSLFPASSGQKKYLRQSKASRKSLPELVQAVLQLAVAPCIPLPSPTAPPPFLGNFEKIGKTSCENTTHVVRFWGHRFGSVRFGSVHCNALRCGSLGSLGLFPIFLFSSCSSLFSLGFSHCCSFSFLAERFV